MATGITTTQQLADSVPSIRQSARIAGEYPQVMAKLVDRYTLGEGEGISWNEISLSRLTAQDITETTVLDNAQQIVDTLFSVVPAVVGVSTLITDRTMKRLSKNVIAKIGSLGRNAIERKLDTDLLTVLDSGTSLAGAETTLTLGHITAATSRARYGAGVEPGTGPGRIVLQAYQLKDIHNEVTAGVSTYPVPAGLTEEVFRQGFQGEIDGFMVYVDDLITIDADNDAKGGVFTQDTIVLVQGRTPYTRIRERPEVGGGANEVFLYNEYGIGVRLPNSLFELYSDATAPTG